MIKKHKSNTLMLSYFLLRDKSNEITKIIQPTKCANKTIKFIFILPKLRNEINDPTPRGWGKGYRQYPVPLYHKCKKSK